MKKNKFKIVIIIEIITLLILASYIFLNKDITTQIDVSLEQWRSKYIEQEDGIWSVSEGDLEVVGKIKLIQGPEMPLDKGSYTLTVWYDCETDQSFFPCADEPYDHYVKANEVKLDKNQSMAVYDFYIQEKVDNFEIEFKYNGNGDFTVSNIELIKNSNIIHKAFATVLLFLILSVIFFCSKNNSTETKEYLLIILGITLLCSLPLTYNGINNGHDLMFHLSRIEGIAKELRLGNFPVRISSVWLGEYGYPTSIYYGDIFLYIPAMLRIIGFTVTESYKIFLFLLNMTTAIVAEWSFRNIFADKRIARILTLVYTTATYRLVCLYVRSAIGECSAYLILPLILIAIYKMYTDNKTIKKNVSNALLLAIGMFVLINTHILSAEIVVFVLALICLIFWKKTKTIQTIRTYLLSVFITSFMSIGFLVPFLDYYINVSAEITNKISEIAPIIQRKGLSIAELFVVFRNPFGSGGEMYATPGVLLVLTLITLIVLLYKKKLDYDMKRLSALTLVLVFMSTNVFPWDSLASRLRIFSYLAQVQFPWRFIGIVIILLTFLLGMLLVKIHNKELNIKYKNIYGVCVGIAIMMTCIFVSYYSDYARKEIYYDTLDVNTYFIQGEEYLRTGTGVEDFTGKIVSNKIKKVELISRKGTEINVKCITGDEEGTITFPVLNYKGYAVSDNQGMRYDIADSDNSLVSCTIPPGFDGELCLHFEEPWYWTVSFGASVISCVIVLGTLMVLKLKEKSYCDSEEC